MCFEIEIHFAFEESSNNNILRTDAFSWKYKVWNYVHVAFGMFNTDAFTNYPYASSKKSWFS